MAKKAKNKEAGISITGADPNALPEAERVVRIPAPTHNSHKQLAPRNFLSKSAVAQLIEEGNAGKTLSEKIAYWWNLQCVASTALRDLQLDADYTRAVRFITGTPIDSDKPLTAISPALAEQLATLNSVAA